MTLNFGRISAVMGRDEGDSMAGSIRIFGLQPEIVWPSGGEIITHNVLDKQRLNLSFNAGIKPFRTVNGGLSGKSGFRQNYERRIR